LVLGPRLGEPRFDEARTDEVEERIGLNVDGLRKARREEPCDGRLSRARRARDDDDSIHLPFPGSNELAPPLLPLVEIDHTPSRLRRRPSDAQSLPSPRSHE